MILQDLTVVTNHPQKSDLCAFKVDRPDRVASRPEDCA